MGFRGGARAQTEPFLVIQDPTFTEGLGFRVHPIYPEKKGNPDLKFQLSGDWGVQLLLTSTCSYGPSHKHVRGPALMLGLQVQS